MQHEGLGVLLRREQLALVAHTQIRRVLRCALSQTALELHVLVSAAAASRQRLKQFGVHHAQVHRAWPLRLEEATRRCPACVVAVFQAVGLQRRREPRVAASHRAPPPKLPRCGIVNFPNPPMAFLTDRRRPVRAAANVARTSSSFSRAARYAAPRQVDLLAQQKAVLGAPNRVLLVHLEALNILALSGGAHEDLLELPPGAGSITRPAGKSVPHDNLTCLDRAPTGKTSLRLLGKVERCRRASVR